MPVFGDERQRRGDLPGREAAQLLRRVADEVAVELQHGGGVAQLVEHRAAVDLADRVQPILERRDDTEVAAAAAEGPEQLLVLPLAGGQGPAVGGDDLGREQVVAGQANAASEVADPAAEREPPNAGRGDDAASGGQSVGVGCVVECSPRRSTLSPRRPAFGINLDRLHARQVDHDRVVCGAEAGNAVRAPTHRQVEAALAGEVHRRRYVVAAGAPDDDARSPVDHRVVDPARLLVRGVVGSDGLSPHLVAQLSHRRRCHRCSSLRVVAKTFLLRTELGGNPVGRAGVAATSGRRAPQRLRLAELWEAGRGRGGARPRLGTRREQRAGGSSCS